MTFFNEQLSELIERGATGGPMWDTAIGFLDGGGEQRNKNWIDPLMRFEFGYGVLSATELDEVRDMHYNVSGRHEGFLFRDWSDHTIGTPKFVPTSPQQIALGDGATTVFQVVRRHEKGARVYERPIYKIESPTDRVFINAVEQTRVTSGLGPGEYLIDYDTGLITTGTLLGGPASGGDGPSGEDVLNFLGLFFIPVRFEDDQWFNRSLQPDAHTVPNLALIETRDIA